MLKMQSLRPPSGLLILRVKRARRLPDMDYNGLMDAFVEIKHAGVIESSSSSSLGLANQAVVVRTPVDYQTTAPSWDFQHMFQLCEGERKGELEIHIYVEGRGLVKDDYVGGVTMKWKCNEEWGEEVVADKWYDIGKGDKARRHKGSVVNKLWRRNTGESLLSNGVRLGQVQCQAFVIHISRIGRPPSNSHKIETTAHEISSSVRDNTELRQCQIRGFKILLALAQWESRELYARKHRALRTWSKIQDRGTTALNPPPASSTLVHEQPKSEIEQTTSNSLSSNSISFLTKISMDQSELQSMNDRIRLPEIERDCQSKDVVHSCEVGDNTQSQQSAHLMDTVASSRNTSEEDQGLQSMQMSQMRILELVNLSSSSPTGACATALEGSSVDTTIAEDDQTVCNIGQNMEESSRIFVAVRIRPGTRDEKLKAVTAQPGGKQVLVRRNDREPPRLFAYDLCFDEEATQQQIFNELGVNILQNSMNGFNTSLFAYGPTSSGKSYTMLGPSGADMGLIPRIAHHLFFLAKHAECNGSVEVVSVLSSFEIAYLISTPKYHIVLEVSCLEVYNERVRDLINPTKQTSNSSGGLRVRESPSGVFVEGLTRCLVKDMAEMEDVITSAIEARARIKQQSDVSKGKMLERQSHINLIDLAGSERNAGSRMVEGCKINQSLTALGRVITILGKGKGNNREHIPYRDSTLTMILKESLGGNSKTAMLACISPGACNIEETLSTLRYANSAKHIKTRAVVNEDPTASMISRLQVEVERLRSLLTCTESETQQQGGGGSGGGNFGAMRKESHGQIAAIEGKIREQQISLARRDNLDKSNMPSRRCSLNAISPEAYDGGPYLLLMHPDPTLEGRLRYAIPEGRTRLGRTAAAGRFPCLSPPQMTIDVSSTCDSSTVKEKGPEESLSGCELEFPGGIGIRPSHCVFLHDSKTITVAPLQSNARVFVDGRVIFNPTPLHHGSRVVLGCCTLVFNVIWPEDKTPTQIRGDTSHRGYTLMSHSQILNEVSFGGEEENSLPQHREALPDLKEMYLSKHLRQLEDECLHTRLMVLEANTVAQDLEQDVAFTIEMRIQVDAKAGSCTLQHLMEVGNVSIMVVATRLMNHQSRDEGAATPATAMIQQHEDVNISSFLNKHQNIVARWPASQFAFVQESLMDVYGSLSELIREKEERGQGTLLVDIFESVAARGRSPIQPSTNDDSGPLGAPQSSDIIGPLQLAEMFGKCGMPCKPDDVKSILSEYDKDGNGLLEVNEFKALMRNVMNSCFNECLKHENLDFSKSDENHSIKNRQQNGGGSGPLTLPSNHNSIPSNRGSTIIGIAWASHEREKSLYSSSRVAGKELWQGG